MHIGQVEEYDQGPTNVEDPGQGGPLSTNRRPLFRLFNGEVHESRVPIRPRQDG